MIAATAAHILSYTTITSTELRAKLDSGFFAALIDTRRQDEWNAGHLPGATFVETLHLTGVAGTLLPPCKDCAVATYCHSGVRSKQAAEVSRRRASPTCTTGWELCSGRRPDLRW